MFNSICPSLTLQSWQSLIVSVRFCSVNYQISYNFTGILDQGAGVLTIFDHSPVDKTYENSLEIIHSMSKVMDALYHKSKKLS